MATVGENAYDGACPSFPKSNTRAANCKLAMAWSLPPARARRRPNLRYSSRKNSSPARSGSGFREVARRAKYLSSGSIG